MFKKSLITGSVTLILLALLTLAGCSNPTGNNGLQGRDGTLVLQGTISAGDLAEYFEDVHIIKLATGTTTVAGVVPPGKTLQIAGSVAVAADELTLTGGTVHILDTGALDIATNTLNWESGGLVIEGDLVLDAADDDFFADGVPGWVAFGATGAVDLQGSTVANINTNFGYGVPAIKADPTSTPLTDLANFPDWIGGRKLIAYGVHATTTNVLDLTARGPLVIGTANRTGAAAGSLTIDEVTNQGAFLVSRGGGSIIVAENASLILDANGWLPNNIPITVYGKLSAASTAEIQEIPPNVDLSRGTLTAEATGTPTFTFGPRAVNIGKIEMPGTSGSITINGVPLTGGVRQQVILNVGSIVPFATPVAAILNLPAGTTTVDKIITGGSAQTLTLGTSANGHAGDPVETVKTVFRPSIIIGSSDVEVVRGARLELSGPIDLSNTLVLDSDNLGANWAAQLALITGGTVDTRGDHLVFTGGETLSTELINRGEADFSGTVTFNRSASFAKVTVTAATTVDGRGTFAIAASGNLIVNDDVTFNIKGFGVDPGVSLSLAGSDTGTITIADGKSIVLGPDTQFTAGTNLTLTEGQYLAAGELTIASTNGTSTVITALDEADKGLTISPVGDTANTITLFSDGAAAAVFTAVNGGDEPVVFGKDGIVIPAGSTSGAVLTVSGSGTVGEVTVAGTSAITLGTHTTAAQKGTLFLLDGAKLTAADAPNSGYTYEADNNDFTAAGDFDAALTPTLTGTADGSSTGVEITTKVGTVDAKFTSATVGTN
jgi:hypothetical protein